MFQGIKQSYQPSGPRIAPSFICGLILLSVGVYSLLSALVFWDSRWGVFIYGPSSLIPARIMYAWIFITLGADVNECDALNKTPLLNATRYEQQRLVKLFIKHGADVNAQDLYGNTPLIYAAERRLTIVQELIHAGADVNATNPHDKFTALTWALQRHDVEIVAMLLKAGATHSRGRNINEFHLEHSGDDPAMQEIERLLRFYGAKQNLKPQVEHFLERKPFAQLAREVMEEQFQASGSQAGATEIAEIIKSYL